PLLRRNRSSFASTRCQAIRLRSGRAASAAESLFFCFYSLSSYPPTKRQSRFCGGIALLLLHSHP
ncbi:MAG: hypothetical protein FWD35_04020, partial [Oscillospiraceae bacterium]|nr:hypothetical protein [Oscillospiraceae bacterium]